MLHGGFDGDLNPERKSHFQGLKSPRVQIFCGLTAKSTGRFRRVHLWWDASIESLNNLLRHLPKPQNAWNKVMMAIAGRMPRS
jgi:hypothetical protein